MNISLSKKAVTAPDVEDKRKQIDELLGKIKNCMEEEPNCITSGHLAKARNIFLNCEAVEEFKPCLLCGILPQACDCDKCGIQGCYECISGFDDREDINLCRNCEDDDEEAVEFFKVADGENPDVNYFETLIEAKAFCDRHYIMYGFIMLCDSDKKEIGDWGDYVDYVDESKCRDMILGD